MKLINVTEAQCAGGARLRVSFSDGSNGVIDFEPILAEGGSMVESLRDPRMFERVFVQCGVLTWPNGFDVDAIRLHQEMLSAGLFDESIPKRPGAAAE